MVSRIGNRNVGPKRGLFILFVTVLLVLGTHSRGETGGPSVDIREVRADLRPTVGSGAPHSPLWYVELEGRDGPDRFHERLLLRAAKWVEHADGHGVRVAHLRPGDRIHLENGRDAQVLDRGPWEPFSVPSQGAQRVVATVAHSTDRITTVVTSKGSVISTPLHLFDVAGRGWRPAGELKPGDLLRSLGGEPRTVLAVHSKTVRPTHVYNLTIARHHTYYVGSGGVRVHNTPGCTPKPSHSSENTEQVALAHHQIRLGKFETGRNLQNYVEAFSPAFAKKLASLGPDAHWVDMGSGSGIALAAYGAPTVFPPEARRTRDAAVLAALETLQKKAPEQRAQTMGITRQVMAPKIYAWNPMNGNLVDEPIRRPTLLTGRFLHEIPNEQIPKADLITDYFGVFAYDPHPDQVLKRYGDHLKDDGDLFIYIGGESTGFAGQTKVEGPSGTTRNLRDWLAAHPTFATTFEPALGRSVNGGSPGLPVAHLRKRSPEGPKGEGLAREESLVLVDSDNGAPPIRTFVLVPKLAQPSPPSSPPPPHGP